MHSRNGDMRRVGRGFPREDAGSQDRRREVPDSGRDIEHGKVPDDQQSFPRCARVPGAGLINDQLRNVNLERTPPLLPPILGDLLVAGDDQISAGPRGEIARNGRFHVKSLLHLDAVPPLIQLVTLMSRQTWIKPVPVGPAKQREPTGGQASPVPSGSRAGRGNGLIMTNSVTPSNYPRNSADFQAGRWKP